MMVRARCSEEDRIVNLQEASVTIKIKSEGAYMIDWSLAVVLVKQQTASSGRLRFCVSAKGIVDTQILSRSQRLT
jgi:hypothetical protein